MRDSTLLNHQNSCESLTQHMCDLFIVHYCNWYWMLRQHIDYTITMEGVWHVNTTSYIRREMTFRAHRLTKEFRIKTETNHAKMQVATILKCKHFTNSFPVHWECFIVIEMIIWISNERTSHWSLTHELCVMFLLCRELNHARIHLV